MGTIIFDIDGTLVQSFEYDARFYMQAVRDVYGPVEFRTQWDQYAHVTDSGILAQLLEDNKIQRDDEQVQAVRDRFYNLTETYLEQNPSLPTQGALETFHNLCEDEAWRVGIATGGWRHTAQAKLRSAGFSVSETPMVSSDDHYDRTEIMKRCRQAVGSDSGQTIYVGDGPWDLRASSRLGWSFIAVGPALQGKHDPWIERFDSPDWEQAIHVASATV